MPACDAGDPGSIPGGGKINVLPLPGGQVIAPTTHSIGCLNSSLGRVPACRAGGPGSIPGRCSSIIEDVMYTLPPSTSSQPSSKTPPPPTTAIFRTFKKSTAPYKVHNMGLRYIKSNIGLGNKCQRKAAKSLYVFQSSFLRKGYPPACHATPSTLCP